MLYKDIIECSKARIIIHTSPSFRYYSLKYMWPMGIEKRDFCFIDSPKQGKIFVTRKQTCAIFYYALQFVKRIKKSKLLI